MYVHIDTYIYHMWRERKRDRERKREREREREREIVCVRVCLCVRACCVIVRVCLCLYKREFGGVTAHGWNNRTLISHERLVCSKMCFSKTKPVQ